MPELKVPVVPITQCFFPINDSDYIVQEGAITIVREGAHLEVFRALPTYKKKVGILPFRVVISHKVNSDFRLRKCFRKLWSS